MRLIARLFFFVIISITLSATPTHASVFANQRQISHLTNLFPALFTPGAKGKNAQMPRFTPITSYGAYESGGNWYDDDGNFVCSTTQVCESTYCGGLAYCDPREMLCVGSYRQNNGCCSTVGAVYPESSTGLQASYVCASTSTGPAWTWASADPNATSTTTGNETCDPTTSTTSCVNQNCWPPDTTATDQATSTSLTCTFSAEKYIWASPTSSCIPPLACSKDSQYASAASCTSAPSTCVGQPCSTAFDDPTYLDSNGLWTDWDSESLIACTLNSDQTLRWTKVASSGKCAALTKPLAGTMTCTSNSVVAMSELSGSSSQTVLENGQGSGTEYDIYTDNDLSLCGIARTDLKLTKAETSSSVSTAVSSVTLSNGVINFACYGGGTVTLTYNVDYPPYLSE